LDGWTEELTTKYAEFYSDIGRKENNRWMNDQRGYSQLGEGGFESAVCIEGTCSTIMNPYVRRKFSASRERN
jgi:hypothetical protein